MVQLARAALDGARAEMSERRRTNMDDIDVDPIMNSVKLPDVTRKCAS